MREKIATKLRKLETVPEDHKTREIIKKDLEDLPVLIQNYLKKTNLLSIKPIKTVKLNQKGHFKLTPDSKWKSFTAEQHVNVEKMSFLWYAKIRMNSLMKFYVIDEFIEGNGALKAKIFNFVTVVDEKGKKLDQGEFLRFLSEAPWYPSFYLNPKIVWDEIDERTLNLTIRKNQNSISGNLIFENSGFIKEFTAKRYYTNNEKKTLEQWHGYFESYEDFSGISIPASFKVCWHLGSGDFCYIKGKIVNIEFNVI